MFAHSGFASVFNLSLSHGKVSSVVELAHAGIQGYSHGKVSSGIELAHVGILKYWNIGIL
jgi:hypothetical protein